MTRLRSNTHDVTHWIVTLAVGAAVFLIGCHFARAAGMAPNDPGPALSAGGGAALDTLRIDGPWWLAIATLNVGLRLFLDRQHWLQQGRLLTALTSGSAILAAVAAYHWQGAPAAGILTAVLAGGTLLIHPAPTPPTKPGSALIASILLSLAVACHTAAVQQVKDDGKAAASAVLDCEKRLAPGQLEQGLVLLAADLASMVLAHGAIDWNALATAAIGDASEVRACAIAEYHAVMSATAPAPAAEARLMSVNPPPVNALAAAIAKIKAARGVSAIMTPGGPV